MTREEFMDYVYELLSEDSDNIRANLIINAADEYAENYLETQMKIICGCD